MSVSPDRLMFAGGTGVNSAQLEHPGDLPLWGGGPSIADTADWPRETLQTQVDNGSITDCEALAQFAESAQFAGTDLMISSFGTLVPTQFSTSVLGAVADLSSRAVGTESRLNRNGSQSGFRQQYQDSRRGVVRPT